MLLIGLIGCPGCKTIHEAHQEIPYVAVPKLREHCTTDVLPIWDALSRLQITKFPVLMNDTLTATLPLETIDPKLKGYNED